MSPGYEAKPCPQNTRVDNVVQGQSLRTGVPGFNLQHYIHKENSKKGQLHYLTLVSEVDGGPHDGMGAFGGASGCISNRKPERM